MGEAGGGAAEGEFDVPAFELGAAVEVEAEAGADVEGFDDGDGDEVPEIGPPVVGVGDGEGGIGVGVEEVGHFGETGIGGEDGREGEEAEEGGEFEFDEDPGEAGAGRAALTSEAFDTGAEVFAALAFEEPDGEDEAATGAEASPEEGGEKEAGPEAGPFFPGVAEAGAGAESGAADEVEGDAVVEGFEPPDDAGEEEGVIFESDGEDDPEGEDGGGPETEDAGEVAADEGAAEVGGFPREAWAQGDREVLKSHGTSFRRIQGRRW